MRMVIFSLSLMILFTGCMSEREFMLRRINAENQRAHPVTYTPIVISGPVEVGVGGTITANVPTQPFQPIAVPDGVEAQRRIIRDVITGAVIGYGLHQASGDSVSNSHNVTGE